MKYFILFGIIVFLILEVVSLIKKIRSKKSTNQVNNDNDNKKEDTNS